MKQPSHKIQTSLKDITFTAGFTLLELMITISIFVILTAVVLSSNNRFGNDVSITNLAYDIALSVRQAQTYGFAVQNVKGSFGNTNGQLNHFGIHFDVTSQASKKSYLIFADLPTGNLPANGMYDINANPSELVTTYTLNNGFTINDICSVDDTQNPAKETCSANLLGGPATSVDIVFTRPNPDASMQFFNGNTSLGIFGHVRIKIQTADGSRAKAIDILQSGQVSVEDASTTQS